MSESMKYRHLGGQACRAAGFLIFLALMLALILPQAALAVNVWTITHPLNTGRDQHTATLLPSGQVLVVGGRDTSGDYLASAELYNPATGTWEYTHSLPGEHPIADHTATLLADGQVLVAGGTNNTGEQSRAFLYNPAAGNWTETASLPTPRTNHTATLLPKGTVLVVGGANLEGPNPYLGSACLYKPNEPAWVDAGSLAMGRAFHTATLLPNGRVLVAGGINNKFLAESTAEVFTGESWIPTGSLGTARYQHTATLLADGRVLVAGGWNDGELNDAEIYNRGESIPTASLPALRRLHTATLLPNGRVLLAGGDAAGTGAELFNPKGVGSWQAAPPMHVGRCLHTATLLAGGRVLVAGGFGSNYRSAEFYTPQPLANPSLLLLLLGD